MPKIYKRSRIKKIRQSQLINLINFNKNATLKKRKEKKGKCEKWKKGNREREEKGKKRKTINNDILKKKNDNF